jgi:hypothetical protein
MIEYFIEYFPFLVLIGFWAALLLPILAIVVGVWWWWRNKRKK